MGRCEKGECILSGKEEEEGKSHIELGLAGWAEFVQVENTLLYSKHNAFPTKRKSSPVRHWFPSLPPKSPCRADHLPLPGERPSVRKKRDQGQLGRCLHWANLPTPRCPLLRKPAVWWEVQAEGYWWDIVQSSPRGYLLKVRK